MWARTGTVVRMTARLTSLVTVTVLLLFVLGEKPVVAVGAREAAGLMFFPLGVSIGLVIAWWRERIGSVVSIASLAGFYLVYGALLGGAPPRGPWFAVFTSPAVLFLLSSFLPRRASSWRSG